VVSFFEVSQKRGKPNEFYSLSSFFTLLYFSFLFFSFLFFSFLFATLKLPVSFRVVHVLHQQTSVFSVHTLLYSFIYSSMWNDVFYREVDAKVTAVNTALTDLTQARARLDKNTKKAESQQQHKQQRQVKSKFKRFSKRRVLFEKVFDILERINNLAFELATEPLALLPQPVGETAEVVATNPGMMPTPAEIISGALQASWQSTVNQLLKEFPSLREKVKKKYCKEAIRFTRQLADEGEYFLMPHYLMPEFQKPSKLEDYHKYFRYDEKSMGDLFYQNTKFGTTYYQFSLNDACWTSFMAREGVNERGVRCMAQLPDGSILTGVGDSPVIRRWKLVELASESSFSPATTVTLYPDGCGSSMTICIKGDATRRFELYQTFEGHLQTITTIVVLLDEDTCKSDKLNGDDTTDFRFISGSLDSTLKLWSTKTGKLIHTFEGHEDDITCAALMKKSQALPKLLCSGCKSGLIKVWSLDEPDYKCLRTIYVDSEITSLIHADNMMADGRGIVSLSKDGVLRLWQLEILEPVATRIFATESDYFMSRGIHVIQLDNGLVVVASGSDLVFFSLMTDGELFRVREAHYEICGLVKRRDGMTFLSVGDEIKGWNSRAEPLFSCQNSRGRYNYTPSAICEMNDGSIACGCDSGLVLLWNTTPTYYQFSYLFFFTTHKSILICITISFRLKDMCALVLARNVKRELVEDSYETIPEDLFEFLNLYYALWSY